MAESRPGDVRVAARAGVHNGVRIELSSSTSTARDIRTQNSNPKPHPRDWISNGDSGVGLEPEGDVSPNNNNSAEPYSSWGFKGQLRIRGDKRWVPIDLEYEQWLRRSDPTTYPTASVTLRQRRQTEREPEWG